jgi:putative ABC transport system permease protein
MTMLKQIVRALLLTPGFTVTVLATLAISIGANSAIFSVLNGVVLKPLPYDDSDELVMVWEANPSQGLNQEPTSGATFADWREQASSFESLAAYSNRGFTLMLDDVPVRIASVQVTPSLFDVLQVAPALGRTFLPEEEAPGNERLVILSDGSWRNRFGADAGIVGRTIPLDGEPYLVVGVMPRGFAFPVGDAEVEAWSPLTLSLENLPSRPHRSYSTIGRLGEGSTLESARAEMTRIAGGIAAAYPESHEGWSVTLISAEEQLVGDTAGTVWILFGAVSLVLLIGCVNVASLLLVRAGSRSRNVAVHAAFGATPRDLLRAALAEGLVLGVTGGVAGLLVAWASVGLLRSVLPAGFPRLDEIALDPMVVAFTAAVSCLAGVLFSLPPALRNMRPDIVGVLQDAGRGSSLGRRGRRVLNVLVAAEVALALVLTVGAGLLVRSYAALSTVDPGYRTDGVVAAAVELPSSRYPQSALQAAFFNDVMARIREIPGVEAAGAVSYLPMSPIGTEFDMPFTVEGLESSSPSQRPTAEYRGILPGYFETMGIDVVAGRTIDAIDGTDGSRVAIINETVVRRYFPDRDPIGQVIDMPMAGSTRVIGVVSDIRHDGLGVAANPEMFVPFAQLPLSAMHLVAYAPGGTSDVVTAIRREILAVDPQQPITRVNLMSDLVSDSVAPSRFNMALLLGLALCAVLLSIVGVFGVVSYSVSMRTRELGVRLAIGAGAGEAVRLVLVQAGRVVLLGAVAGVLASLALVPAIEALLYGVEPLDPRTFVVAPIGLLVVAMAAAAIPALRAGRIDPATTLRRD